MSRLDPCFVLGITPGASLDEARAARRRLAKLLHPDLHADASPAERSELAAHMTQVNAALAQIEAEHRTEPPVADPGDPASPTGPANGGGPAAPCGPADPDSFSVAWLPAEAFEALFLAAYGLGDILVADEPYLLELYLVEPAACFCRLTLVPEAGGSLVTVELGAPAEPLVAPEPEAVIEVLVAELNALAAR